MSASKDAVCNFQGFLGQQGPLQGPNLPPGSWGCSQARGTPMARRPWSLGGSWHSETGGPSSQGWPVPKSLTRLPEMTGFFGKAE